MIINCDNNFLKINKFEPESEHKPVEMVKCVSHLTHLQITTIYLAIFFD